jgi:hypothetical protein
MPDSQVCNALSSEPLRRAMAEGKRPSVRQLTVKSTSLHTRLAAAHSNLDCEKMWTMAAFGSMWDLLGRGCSGVPNKESGVCVMPPAVRKASLCCQSWPPTVVGGVVILHGVDFRYILLRLGLRYCCYLNLSDIRGRSLRVFWTRGLSCSGCVHPRACGRNCKGWFAILSLVSHQWPAHDVPGPAFLLCRDTNSTKGAFGCTARATSSPHRQKPTSIPSRAPVSTFQPSGSDTRCQLVLHAGFQLLEELPCSAFGARS